MLQILLACICVISTTLWLGLASLSVPESFEATRWTVMQTLQAVGCASFFWFALAYRKGARSFAIIGAAMILACIASGFAYGLRYGYLYFGKDSADGIDLPKPTGKNSSPGIDLPKPTGKNSSHAIDLPKPTGKNSSHGIERSEPTGKPADAFKDGHPDPNTYSYYTS